MIYIGRVDDDGRRAGFHVDNGAWIRFMPNLLFAHLMHLHSPCIATTVAIEGIKYIFGTGFDETHKEIEEADLRHEHYGPNAAHDVADRARGKTREQVLHEKRRGELDLSKGPKPFGWFGE